MIALAWWPNIILALACMAIAMGVLAYISWDIERKRDEAYMAGFRRGRQQRPFVIPETDEEPEWWGQILEDWNEWHSNEVEEAPKSE